MKPAPNITIEVPQILGTEEVIELAARILSSADSYFGSSEELSDDDRELLRLFTKLCIAHKLTEVHVREYREALNKNPEWKTLIRERAVREHFTPAEMAQLETLMEQLSLFALGLVGSSENSVPKKLEEKMLAAVNGNTTVRRIYEASHD